LGQAIGLALDKAILYGTGTKMPKGIITRLVETEQPASDTSTIPWEDLHASNVLSIAANKTGTAFFKELIVDSGAASGKYSRGTQFWAMNDKTYKKVVAESVGFNAAGAVVAGVQATMPVIGGDIVVLDFVQDDVIIGGYGDLYLLAEREGTTIGQSEHAQYIQDNTVFKGTARYDGLPVIAKGFVAIGINGATPSATMTFAADTANNG
jgi:HK97 family phage major capsid protein